MLGMESPGLGVREEEFVVHPLKYNIVYRMIMDTLGTYLWLEPDILWPYRGLVPEIFVHFVQR